MKSSETVVGARLPDGGLVVSGKACAALSGALRAHIAASRRAGLPLPPAVMELTRLADNAAADYERRRSTPNAVGNATLVSPIAAPPRSDWVSVRNAASALGLAERQTRNLCENGILHAAKDSRHQWRIDPQSIQRERARRTHGQGGNQGTDSG